MARSSVVSGRTASHGEEGMSLAVVVVSVLVLAVLAVGVAVGLRGAGTTGGDALAPGTPTTTAARGSATPTTAPGIPLGALRASCVAGVRAVRTALDYYTSLNGMAPPAGTAWATAASPSGPLLQSWPSGHGTYTISWNGAVLVVAPAHGTAASGSAGTESPPTGCYAVH